MRRIWLVVTVAALLAGACGQDAGTPSPATAGGSGEAGGDPLRGFSVSPRSTSPEDFAAFLDHLAEGATLLEWVGDAMEWGEPDAGPEATAGIAAQTGVVAVTVGGWSRTEDGEFLRPPTDEAADGYVEAAASFAARHRPRFMGFGVEVDSNWRAHPDEWGRATEMFARFAAAVEASSPETSVFVVFQLERMRGMHGGLFGGENDPEAATWHLIDDFPDADLIAFTTYPGLVFESPADLPDEYYSSILDHVDRPIAFTEVGWQAGGDLGPYTGDPGLQAEFITRFEEMLAGLDVGFVTWAFMYDQPIGEPFSTMGLFDSSGEPRIAWDAWLAFAAGSRP
ncbi:MAG: hypothetical protein KQH83_01125 [Actinobacteria bacterium]|nr:hypothetical protein [Actinomycetota bacterium]